MIFELHVQSRRSDWLSRSVVQRSAKMVGGKRCSRSSFARVLRRVKGGQTMPYSAEHKESTRQRIVTSAARLFNRKGFSEVTICEIMTAAGLTHGGFYRHFKSKDELYSEVITQFLGRPPEPWQQKPAERCAPGQPFARYVVDVYLSREHLEDVDGCCPLIGLPSDAARGSEAGQNAHRVDATAVRGHTLPARSGRRGPRTL